MKKKKRLLLVIAVVLATGLSYGTYSLFVHAEAEYLTVSELLSQADSLQNQRLRVEGMVAPGSIDWNNETKVISFTLTDNRESLPVVHQGIVPDNFKPGTDLIVEGKHRPDGIFEALSFGSRRSFCNVCH